MTYAVGDTVLWEWGSGKAEGIITRCFTDDVSRTLKGTLHATCDRG
ncbi:MAG: HVA1 family protein [Roseobacter sp.]|nr:HVA1 family protein [Roseobacter sp.]